MTLVPKKSKLSGEQPGIRQILSPDTHDSFEDQVDLFTKRSLTNSSRPIYGVWSKLDPTARSVVLFELGCFNEKTRDRYHKRAREDGAVLKKHLGMLETFLKRQADHDTIVARRPRFYMPRLYYIEPEGKGTLKKVLEIEVRNLEWGIAQINRSLQKHSKWDVRGVILVQEYVTRRVDFLKLPKSVRLTPDAIADIYDITKCTGVDNSNLNTGQNLRKAIAYYKKLPENQYFIQNIEFYLQDWKKSTR
jgi:hypothetical protein